MKACVDRSDTNTVSECAFQSTCRVLVEIVVEHAVKRQTNGRAAATRVRETNNCVTCAVDGTRKIRSCVTLVGRCDRDVVTTQKQQ